MIQLYSGCGSTEVQLAGKPILTPNWADNRRVACQLLRAMEKDDAAQLLESISFDLYEGTNSFGDEFFLLYLNAAVNQYVELANQKENPQTRAVFRQIAETLSEIGTYIRFIVVELDAKSSIPIASPSLAITSDVVERALADCEQLIHSRGATSGVDRVHTAFHGYLRAVCTKNRIDLPDSAGITQLFKAIRKQHPSFIIHGSQAHDIDRITSSLATIIDSLNPLRNQATLAHPNDVVLEEAEAMLVINTVRTMLNYFNAKMG